MKYIYTTLFYVFISLQSWGQAPQKMSYQAVIRDSNGDLISNQVIGVKISILKGSVDGDAVYEETQNPETNEYGLMSLEIGGNLAKVIDGSLSEINWTNDQYFIKTETDPNGGTDYTISGTSQLLSVPYALHANSADRLTSEITYEETDPKYSSSIASGIDEQDTASWNNKLDFYIETDPEFNSSIASGIQVEDTAYWNNKLDDFIETDPFFNSSTAKGITQADTSYWNNKLESYTETDPEFNSSIASTITQADTSSWNNKLDEEIDGSVDNEIQTLSVSKTGDTLFLSKSNWVIVPNISSANSNEVPAPVVLDVLVDLQEVADGTNVTLTTKVDDPYYTNVNYIGLTVLNPSQEVFYSFGEQVVFNETDPGIFEYSHTFLISSTDESGEYTLIDLMIENEEGDTAFNENKKYWTISN
jgi:hypothetical protein